MKPDTLTPTPPRQTAPNYRKEMGGIPPWLFSASMLLSAVLFILYLNKPVYNAPMVTQQSPQTVDPYELMEQEMYKQDYSSPPATDADFDFEDDLVNVSPNSNVLPGRELPEVAEEQPAKTNHPKAVDLTSVDIDTPEVKNANPEDGWEPTNLKVQHVLNAQWGNGSQQKIMLEVPVLYHSRSFHWTADDIRKAREILRRLQIYENNIARLKAEGDAIMLQWNMLSESSMPVDTLRADSPSLNQTITGGKANLLPAGNEQVEIIK